jgi:hypothetical protein
LEMKRKVFRLTLILGVVAFIAIAAAAMAARQADAGTEKIEFVGYNLGCEILEWGEEWWDLEDGTYHLRGRVIRTVVVSDNEFHNGEGRIVSNYNYDPASGVYTYHGTLEISPYAVDGYWAGSWTLKVVPSGAGGKARLQGYGPDLVGWQIKSDLTPLPPPVLAQMFPDACGEGQPPFTGVKSQATLLMPGGE